MDEMICKTHAIEILLSLKLKKRLFPVLFAAGPAPFQSRAAAIVYSSTAEGVTAKMRTFASHDSAVQYSAPISSIKRDSLLQPRLGLGVMPKMFSSTTAVMGSLINPQRQMKRFPCVTLRYPCGTRKSRKTNHPSVTFWWTNKNLLNQPEASYRCHSFYLPFGWLLIL